MASDPTTGSPEMTAPAAAPRRRSWGDVYTWMLILSLLFLMVGCGMLLLEWSRYWADSMFQIRPAGF